MTTAQTNLDVQETLHEALFLDVVEATLNSTLHDGDAVVEERPEFP
jgi:hypothetical protein